MTAIPTRAKGSTLPSADARRARRRKLALIALGIALIVLGMVGGILPVVPGTPLTLLGVGMVATHSPRGRWLRWRVTGWLRQRGVPIDRLLRRGRRRPSREALEGRAG